MKIFKLKHITLICGLMLHSVARLFAEDASIFLDLSKSHDFKIVRDTGVFIRDFPGDKGYYVIHAKSIRVRFPGGNELSQKVRSLTANLNEFDQIDFMRFYGPGMPTDVAYAVAKGYFASYGVSTDELDKWFEDNKNKGREGMAFQGGGPTNHYPSFGIEITSAVNPLYPWKVSVGLGWKNIRKREQGRDEKWGEQNNPRLPEGMAVLSLDPPDGKVYDPMDAYKHLAGRQEALDKKLGQIRGPDGRLIHVEKPENREAKPNSLPPRNEKPDKVSPFAAMALIGTCILFALAVWYFIKGRKHDDSE